MPLKSGPVARALALSILLLGCDGAAGEDASVPAGDAGPPSVEIGTGFTEFEPIAEGGDLEFTLGPQGGFHFLASLRARGVRPGNPDDRMDPGNPTTTFRAFVGDRRVDLMASSYTQGLEPGLEPGTYEMVGRLLILDIDQCADIQGMTVRVEVEVVDVAGARVTDERTVTAVPNPLNGC